MRFDVAVAGAGAAGLMAAIFAARANRSIRVAALDGAKKIGAKILISGGGRCNVTHHEVSTSDFHGNRNVIARVLRTFTVPQTIDFFRDLGVELKREETGKLFPVTDRARTVVDALLRAAGDAGVEILTETRVEDASARSGFVLHTSRGEIECRHLVLATGGRSVPKTGSDGHGYSIARSLGHTVTETFPALVPLVIEQAHWMRELSGTSATVELSVRSESGKIVARERGSMLMTHFGISGPVALDISRQWIAARRQDPRAAVVVSFLPGQTFEETDKRLVAASRANARATVSSVLRAEVPDRVLERVAPPGPIATMPREERRAVARRLTEMVIPVTRDRGFDYAEVTAGGVPLTEIDPSTMASRRCPGLFLCGEILDVDGRIGGFNFQWAWASGRLAGLSSAVLA
jgi:predicted Rossmann fold flavoprotein